MALGFPMIHGGGITRKGTLTINKNGTYDVSKYLKASISLYKTSPAFYTYTPSWDTANKYKITFPSYLTTEKVYIFYPMSSGAQYIFEITPNVQAYTIHTQQTTANPSMVEQTAYAGSGDNFVYWIGSNYVQLKNIGTNLNKIVMVVQPANYTSNDLTTTPPTYRVEANNYDISSYKTIKVAGLIYTSVSKTASVTVKTNTPYTIYYASTNKKPNYIYFFTTESPFGRTYVMFYRYDVANNKVEYMYSDGTWNVIESITISNVTTYYCKITFGASYYNGRISNIFAFATTSST